MTSKMLIIYLITKENPPPDYTGVVYTPGREKAYSVWEDGKIVEYHD